MQRILDIDLDFFVQPVAYWLGDDGPRLPNDYSVTPAGEALAFLRDNCGLQAPLPGWAIEHHDEAFSCWRSAIGDGRLEPPFHVTHVDAHADLGLGDIAYQHILLEVMHLPVEDRALPETLGEHLTFANWLAYAVASRWISDLDYVFCEGGGSDLFPYYMNEAGDGIELRAATEKGLSDVMNRIGSRRLDGPVDPVVPVRSIPGDEYTATGPFDAIVVCRSPGYTPASADPLFDLICETFLSDWD